MATTFTDHRGPRPGYFDQSEREGLLTARDHVSWGAIFAGVVVALVAQMLLTLLGAGIGVATLDAAGAGATSAKTISIGAGVWYVVCGVISAFIGGHVAGRLSGRALPTTGALHGLTAWAFTTLLILYLLTTAIGGIVGGAFTGVSSLVGGMTKTVAQTAAPALATSDPLSALEEQVRATGTDPDALNAEAVDAVRALVIGDEASAPDARQRAAEALSQARGIPLDQAEARVDEIKARYDDFMAAARDKAARAADTAASIASTGALLAFVALVLGGAAAWFGGRSGVARPEV